MWCRTRKEESLPTFTLTPSQAILLAKMPMEARSRINLISTLGGQGLGLGLSEPGRGTKRSYVNYSTVYDGGKSASSPVFGYKREKRFKEMDFWDEVPSQETLDEDLDKYMAEAKARKAAAAALPASKGPNIIKSSVVAAKVPMVGDESEGEKAEEIRPTTPMAEDADDFGGPDRPLTPMADAADFGGPDPDNGETDDWN